MWVESCRDSTTVNLPSGCVGQGGTAEMGAAFVRFLRELEIVLGRLICQFVMDENLNIKRTVVGCQLRFIVLLFCFFLFKEAS